MATLSGALGDESRQPYTDLDTGREYEVSSFTQRVKGDYAKWLRQQAFLAVAEIRGTVPDEVYREALSEWQQECSAGAYDFYTPVCARSVRTPTGAITLASLMFWDVAAKRRVTRAEMAEMHSRRRDEIDAVVAVAVAESMPKDQPPGDAEGEGGEGNG